MPGGELLPEAENVMHDLKQIVHVCLYYCYSIEEGSSRYQGYSLMFVKCSLMFVKCNLDGRRTENGNLTFEKW